MKCQKCDTEFNESLTSCGTGYSWSLYKCPKCKQLYASGMLPIEVQKDSNIIIKIKSSMKFEDYLFYPMCAIWIYCVGFLIYKIFTEGVIW